MTSNRAGAVLAILCCAALAAGCGNSSPANSSGASGGSSGVALTASRPAGPNPSQSAKMICQPEAQTDIAEEVGLRPVQPVVPIWVAHLYSCRYVYADGTLTLSVKELSDGAATTAYYNGLKAQLGQTETLSIGQGGFIARNGSVVVRKDYKVLDVDVSALPAQFGSPPASRSDNAVTVADVIMGCWNGS